MMKPLPADIEILITDEGTYIEIESFIRFLRSPDVDPEYAEEAQHLLKIAQYLDDHMAEAIAQRKLLTTDFDKDKPN